jgi:transposase
LHDGKSRINKNRKTFEDKLQKEIKGNYQHDLFEINIEGDPVVTDITWKINVNKKVEIITKYFGKKLLITDHQDWSTEEILKTYSDQYIIERIFRDTKNPYHFSIRPQYHWTDMKIRVHIFCCLLGLIITSLLRKEFEDKGIIIEKGAMIDELTKIRECWVFKKTKKNKNGLKIEKNLEKMTARQSEMWKVVLSL